MTDPSVNETAAREYASLSVYDSRYEVKREYTGHPDGPQWVLRWCEKFVSSHTLLYDVLNAREQHAKDRYYSMVNEA